MNLLPAGAYFLVSLSTVDECVRMCHNPGRGPCQKMGSRNADADEKSYLLYNCGEENKNVTEAQPKQKGTAGVGREEGAARLATAIQPHLNLKESHW